MSKKRPENITSLSDRPRKSDDDDDFNLKKKIVDRIYSFLTTDPILPLTIAITGEWGIGKTSTINWLKDKIEKNKKNIIISFEPLLEGRVELVDIIELFYLNLHDRVNSKELKKIIKNSLKSLMLLTRIKVTGKAQLPMFGAVEVKKDFGKDIDDILALWSEQEFKLFSEQAEAINKQLEKENCTLYVVIDEIDRLTSQNIVNFLLFSRTLELFDRLVCVIGIDYGRVIQKLISEEFLGLSNYDSVKSYMDKLFQRKFPIYINETEKLVFIQNKMKLIDKDNCLSDLFDPKDYNNYREVEDVLSYLSTPRQLKKWLISIKSNYPLIKGSPNRMSFLKFLAVIVLHPLVFENFSKYTAKLLKEKGSLSLPLILKNQYGVNNVFSDKSEKFDEASIFLASLGVKDESLLEANHPARILYEKIFSKHEKNDFNDELTMKFSKDFLEKIPDYIKILLLEGYFDDKSVSVYTNFLQGNIDNALEILIKPTELAEHLLRDLLNLLKKLPIFSIKEPSIGLLVALWKEKSCYSFFNPYYHLILFFLTRGFKKFEPIINEAELSMSGATILYCLKEVGIKKENDRYSIDKFSKKNENLIPSENLVLWHTMNSKCEVKKILKLWLKKFSLIFEDSSSDWHMQTHLINVFEGFIQFGNALGKDNREKLSKCLIKFFKNKNISDEDKKKIVNLITEECARYERSLPSEIETPLKKLFDNDVELNHIIQKFSDENKPIRYIDSFEKLANFKKR